MTGGPLLWHPSPASVLRNSSETTSALCCLPHWIHYNLHIAANIPQTMLLPSPCTLLSPTWKIRTPMWECCLWAIVQHLIPATLAAKLQTLGLNRYLCSWIQEFLTGRSQVVRMGNNTSSPWSSTLVLPRAAFSAHSCIPCTHTTVQPHTVWNEPQHPQIILLLHCGEHPDRLHYCLVWKQHRWQPLSSAKGRANSPSHCWRWASLPPGHLHQAVYKESPENHQGLLSLHPQEDVYAASNPALADWGIAFSLRLSG